MCLFVVFNLFAHVRVVHVCCVCFFLVLNLGAHVCCVCVHVCVFIFVV